MIDYNPRSALTQDCYKFVVTTRATFLRIALSLLLLLSQQMGIAHAVSHLSDGSKRSSQQKSLPIEQACEQCLAFAQIDAALASGIHAIPTIPLTTTALVEAATDSHLRRTVCVFLSRAPPAVI